MSTTKPRITITLEPKVYELLRRLSAVNGHSMSSIVTEFLEVAVPPMERMVVVLEQAKALPAETKEGVRGSILRAEAKVLTAVAAFTDQTNSFLSEVLVSTLADAAGGALHGSEMVPKVLTTPVPVTRGSGRPKRRLGVPSKGGH